METELFWYYLKRIFKRPGERLRYLELEEARKKLNEQEKYLVEWAEEKNIYLITGHSHQQSKAKFIKKGIRDRRFVFRGWQCADEFLCLLAFVKFSRDAKGEVMEFIKVRT